jgi:hypothetical protein
MNFSNFTLIPSRFKNLNAPKFNLWLGVSIFSVFSFVAAHAQPLNDAPSGAIILPITALAGTCPTDVYTNVAASDALNTLTSPVGSCFNGLNAFKDVWFRFTTPATGGRDFRITITGVTAADSIRNPQVAVYIGNPVLGFNQEYCATQLPGASSRSVSLDAGNMRPNTTYYIQVAGFLSTDLGGRFSACIKPFDPVYNMTPIEQTSTACSGTLFDSGGPTANYGPNQNNYTFNIRPNATGCIDLTISDLNTESGFDTLAFFDGRTGELLDRVSGTSGTIRFQARTGWVRVTFSSDASVQNSGFRIAWACSATCTTPLPSSCSNPSVITSLPFRTTGTTCDDALNSVSVDRCNTGDVAIRGKDQVFKITSTGNLCVRISASGLPVTGTRTMILTKDCPDDPASICIARARANFSGDTLSIASASLEVPGDYYIVISRNQACMPFTLNIDTITCVNLLPNAGFCDRALSLNGCSSVAPSNILVDLAQQGDSSFMRFTPLSANAGCIRGFGGVNRYNFTFMYFKAAKDGTFAFNVSPLVASTTSDIDFNVYGPVNRFEDICTFSRTNAPVRSSYAVEGGIPGRRTGLASSYINTTGQNITVNDLNDCDVGAVNDGFVRPLVVQKDKYYLIWINDFNGVIGRDGVRLDLTGTTDSVLASSVDFTVSNDTFICIGRSAQLNASGGVSYRWTPIETLNNSAIFNPIATPTQTTSYSVGIQSTCRLVPKKVDVGVFKVNNVPDATVCIGEELTFRSGTVYPAVSGGVWSWLSPTNNLAELSCTNCPTPTFIATNTSGATQVHTFIARLTTPTCVISDTINITVTTGRVATYAVNNRNIDICAGTSVSLLRPGFDASATYTWRAVPVGAPITTANPSVTPTTSTNYYLTVTGGSGSCNAQSLDSVRINVFAPPTLASAPDTVLCVGTNFQLSNTSTQANTRYSWTPNAGIALDTVPNTRLTVQAGITNYILRATNPGGCSVSDTVRVEGIDLRANLVTPDTSKICKGLPIQLRVNKTLANASVQWRSDRDFSVINKSTDTINISPQRNTRYYVTVNVAGCKIEDSTLFLVDSVPFNRAIMPRNPDTTVCEGSIVILKSAPFEPVLFPNIRFSWLGSNQTKATYITDSVLYNMVINADSTRTYSRQVTNGACVLIDTVRINVAPIARISVLPFDTVFCAGSVVPVTLRASGTPTGVKDWQWKDPQGQDIPGSKDRTSIVVTPPSATGTYRYTVTANVNPVCPGSATATIRVVAPPAPAAFPSPPEVCTGNSIVLNTNPVAAQTYAWTGPNNFTSAAAAPNVTPTVSGTYNVRVTSANGCVVNQSLNLTVATGSLVLASDTSVCGGTPLSITARGTTNSSISSYRWNSGETVATITPQTQSAGNYSVVYSYGPGCSLSRTIRVAITPGLNVRITPDTLSRGLTDQGTNLVLTATVTGNAPSPTYTWSNNATTASISVKPLEDVSYKVTVKSATTGCQDDTTVNVKIRYAKYELPNAFTPNGDTVNAFFGPVFNAIPTPSLTDPRPRLWKGNIQVLSFQIYNRWGAEVYNEMNTSVLNAGTYRGWDGRKNNEDLPSDVYVYILKLKMPDDSVKSESGELNLIR